MKSITLKKMLAMIFKTKMIFFIPLVLSANLFGQVELRNDIIPHSPEAAGIVKNVTTPMTLYTGSPNISIPVYEIKSAKLTLPISLSYNYDGYKPAEEASWIGMGWNLTGLGGITRIVKGQLDELPALQGHFDDYVTMQPLSDKQDFLSKVADGFIDGQPDMYVFNFNGYSGKFIWLDGKAVMFPQQDLLIQKSGTMNNEVFTITTEDGTIYTFGARETTISGGPNHLPQHTSGWFLTSIQSPDKTDEISFTYSNYSHTTPPYFTDIFKKNTQNGQVGTLFTPVINAGEEINSKRISSIFCNSTAVFFDLESTERLDLFYNTGFALKSIRISAEGLSKKINLVHGYAGYHSRLLLKEVHVISPLDNGEVVPDPEPVVQKYLLYYKNESGNYSQNVRAIDYGGFYNGKFTNQSLFDADIINEIGLQEGDRRIDFESASQGVLSKIVYPTGGNTQFEYEGNDRPAVTSTPIPQAVSQLVVFNQQLLGDPSVVGTGHFIIQYEQEVSISFRRTIASTQILNIHPIIELMADYGADQVYFYTSRLLSKTELSFTETITLPPGNYYMNVYCDHNAISSFAELHYFIPGSPNTPEPGIRIKSIKTYDGSSVLTPSITKNYKYRTDAGVSTGIRLGGNDISLQQIQHYNADLSVRQDYIYTAETQNPTNSMLDVSFYYSQVTEINGTPENTGKTIYNFQSTGTNAAGVYLSRQIEYKYASGTYLPVQETINEYDQLQKRSIYAIIPKLFWTGQALQGFINPDYDDPVARWSLYNAENYLMRSCYKQLKSNITKLYDQDGGNPITKKTEYFYENPLHQFPTRIATKNSKGFTETTKLKYPLDFALAGCINNETIESNFNTSVTGLTNDYQTCRLNRRSALTSPVDLHPYTPNTGANQSQFTSIVNSFPCESDFKAASISLFNTRNTAYTTLRNCITDAYTNGSTPAEKAIALMQKNHIISPSVEKYQILTRDGEDFVIAGSKTDYVPATTTTSYVTPVPSVTSVMELREPLLKSVFDANPASYFVPKINFYFDNNINIIGQQDNKAKVSYIWGYDNAYPIAEVRNVTAGGDYAYTSFEAGNTGNFDAYTGTVINAVAPTGGKVYQLTSTAPLHKTLSAAGSFIVSLWASNANVTVNSSAPSKTGETIGQYTYYEYNVNAAAVTISGTANIDEVRLYPQNSQVTTYTYFAGVGIRSICDINNKVTYYEYDGLGRLIRIKDPNGNILKTFTYQYANL